MPPEFSAAINQLAGRALQARQVTAALRDWIDRDDKPVRGGAEDEVYMGMEPPYLAANQPMQDVSELRLIRGIDAGFTANFAVCLCTAYVRSVCECEYSAGFTGAAAGGALSDETGQSSGDGITAAATPYWLGERGGVS